MAKPIGSPGNGNHQFRQDSGTTNTTDPTASNISWTQVGTDGDDYMLGTDGNDALFGGLGNDTLVGLAGMDYLDGGEGSDTYIVNRYADWDTFMDSGTGAADYDIIVAGQDYATIQLTEFSDANGIEEISSGGYWGVKVTGDWGDNVFDFSNTVLSDVTVFTSAGNDTVFGSQGSDHIEGGDGNDIIYGNGGDDLLLGDGGNDIIVGGAGNDVMSGGSGSDMFVYGSVTDGADTIIGFETGSGGDVVDLSSMSVDSVTLTQNGGDAVLTATVGTDSLVISLSGVDATTWSDSDNLIV